MFFQLIVGIGCARPASTLDSWCNASSAEEVVQFDAIHSHDAEWFVRVTDPADLPEDCVFKLTDRFAFVRIVDEKQWSKFKGGASGLPAKAGNRRIPDFRSGMVIGIMAEAGMPNARRWPIHVDSVRRRGDVAFVMATFQPGFYRPLRIPPYLHLVYISGIKQLLNARINHQTFGFNVSIEQLTAAIREPQPPGKSQTAR